MKKVLQTIILFLCFLPFKDYSIGCNFGFTHTVIIGASHSYTIGQGPWGKRKYIMNWGDGSSLDIAYSTPTNSVYISHTYSVNGNFVLSINSSDTLGGGCLSFGNFNISVNYFTTNLIENNLPDVFSQTIFNNEIILKPSQFTLSKIEIRGISGELLIAEKLIRDQINKINTGFLNVGVYVLYLYGEGDRIKVIKAIKTD